MPDEYQYLVIGRGIMGAAAAMHLAAASDGVAALGPTEAMAIADPVVPKASHHDAGRNAHSLDEDPVWSELGARSVARYRNLEQETGVRFFDEIGYVRIHHDGAVVERSADNAERFSGRRPEVMSGDEANERFPFFHLEQRETVGFQSRDAGRINPRAYVAAMTAKAATLGAEMIDDHATEMAVTGDGVRISTASGRSLKASRVIVATGAYATFDKLLPVLVPLHVRGRTIVMVRVDDAALTALEGMPSVGCHPGGARVRTYWHPPVEYPDGRTYLKIGGGPEGPERIASLVELNRWLRSTGDPAMADAYRAELQRMMPGLDQTDSITAACVTSETHSLRPYAQAIHGGKVVILTGGNGHGAKAADALGEIGASLALGAPWPSQAGPDLFALPEAAR
ncbi:MAG: FAD-dependent oxidoreductase [Chloroflexi bacterium]|nr:FAD-dependent oxidoreductase [Chloroflexota bacterium]